VRTLGRYHSLVEINARLPQAELHAKHGPVLGTLEPLIERGQRVGRFRADACPAWHLAMVLAIIHAASATLDTGHASPDEIERELIATVLGAVS
jgi:hypothetical protein